MIYFETRWVNPIVSSGKSILCLVCVGLWPRFLCCFAVVFRGETQIWPGDLWVVWLFVVLVLSGWCSVWICPHLKEAIVFLVEFLSQLNCLYQFQDRALERYRPYQREKKIGGGMPGLSRALEPAQGSKVAFGRLLLPPVTKKGLFFWTEKSKKN